MLEVAVLKPLLFRVIEFNRHSTRDERSKVWTHPKLRRKWLRRLQRVSSFVLLFLLLVFIRFQNKWSRLAELTFPFLAHAEKICKEIEKMLALYTIAIWLHHHARGERNYVIRLRERKLERHEKTAKSVKSSSVLLSPSWQDEVFTFYEFTQRLATRNESARSEILIN